MKEKTIIDLDAVTVACNDCKTDVERFYSTMADGTVVRGYKCPKCKRQGLVQVGNEQLVISGKPI